MLLIAIVTLGIFLTEGNQDYSYKNDATINTFNVVGKKEYLDFGMAVIVLSWITVMSMVVLFVSGRHEKVTINWPALMVCRLSVFYSSMDVQCWHIVSTESIKEIAYSEGGCISNTKSCRFTQISSIIMYL